MLRSTDRVIVNGVPVALGADIADSFQEGDRLFGVDSGRLLHIPRDVHDRVSESVKRARRAFGDLQSCQQEQVTRFYQSFSSFLRDTVVIKRLTTANEIDVRRAQEKGRSTTRLLLSNQVLADMAEALDLWSNAVDRPDETIDSQVHKGWIVDSVRSPLGVVAFVFEGRPNVFSDAMGVLRMGNTCVFRIGSDALETARAIMEHAVRPSLQKAGLPVDSVVLIDDASHASAWSLFAQDGVSLAVARGSGRAVLDLGAVARQSGIPVSLHGTGGAWMLITESADTELIPYFVQHSLDRKVCNTANVVVAISSNPQQILDAIMRGVESAARKRKSVGVVHDLSGLCKANEIVTRVVPATIDDLATEWEWEDDPEITIAVVGNLDEAIDLFNTYSPNFVVSILSSHDQDYEHVWSRARAPFVGNGMTRWVDGQFALERPELGLANWEFGAPIGRGAILSGSDVFTIRYRVRQDDPHLHR